MGSDSESNHSLSTSDSNKQHQASVHQLKSTSATTKKIRHQPYVVKSLMSNAKHKEPAKEPNTIKSHYSRYSTDYIPHSALNPNTNDECWPFLCSLNVKCFFLVSSRR
jgi:hypothetical protein